MRNSGCPIEQLLGLGLKVQPRVLMRFVAGHGGDALDEVENAFGLVTLFGQHDVDDLRRLSLGKPALAQEVRPIVIGAGDDLLPRRSDAVDEGQG